MADNRRQPPTGADEPGLAEKLEPLLSDWRRAGLWPAVLVVPPGLRREAIVALESRGPVGGDVEVVVDAYCPPSRVYLFPKATYQARRTWGRDNG